MELPRINIQTADSVSIWELLHIDEINLKAVHIDSLLPNQLSYPLHPEKDGGAGITVK